MNKVFILILLFMRELIVAKYCQLQSGKTVNYQIQLC